MIPRGGTLTAEAAGEGAAMGFRVAAAGLNARVPAAAPGLVAGAISNGSVDAQAIQPFYAGMLARASGLSISIEPEADKIVIAAR
jgi:histidine phosphotransferase ChpT